MKFSWSLIVGAIFAMLTRTGVGFIFGFVLCMIFFDRIYKAIVGKREDTDPDLFLNVLFETFGALCKSKGRVTETDIEFVTDCLNQFNLSEEKKRSLQSLFNEGKSENYPLRERLQLVYQKYRRSPSLLNTFCEQVIKAAINDGELHHNEQRIILTVAEVFHLPRFKIMAYIQIMMASQEFQKRQQGQQYQYRYTQQEQFRHQGYREQSNYYQPQRNPQSELKQAYSILGVSETDEVTVIKRAYRKLMNEYHPDKLVSKGLPKEMLESAKRRAQEIQSAYDLIKTHRNFK